MLLREKITGAKGGCSFGDKKEKSEIDTIFIFDGSIFDPFSASCSAINKYTDYVSF